MSEPRRYRTVKAAYTHGATTERHPADDYPTPPGFLDALLERLHLPRGTRVWDPAAGGGHLVHRLRDHFDEVEFSDLYYSGQDFLEAETSPSGKQVDWVVTNPPFKHAEEFARQAFTLAPNVALLLNVGFLESAKRAEGLFAEHPPSRVLLNSRKMRLPDGRTSVFAHVWVVWEFGRTDTQFGWLLNTGDRLMPTGRAPGVWPETTPANPYETETEEP